MTAMLTACVVSVLLPAAALLITLLDGISNGFRWDEELG